MNKSELVTAVSVASGLSRGDSVKAVTGVLQSITATLKDGGQVRLTGFGTFSVARRQAATGRNPRTGEIMTIKAAAQPRFKPGKGLKDAVN